MGVRAGCADQVEASKFNLLLSHCEPTQKSYAALFLLPLSPISRALWVFCKTLSINKKRIPYIQDVKLRKKDCLKTTQARHVYIYTLSCKSDSLFFLNSSEWSGCWLCNTELIVASTMRKIHNFLINWIDVSLQGKFCVGNGLKSGVLFP